MGINSSLNIQIGINSSLEREPNPGAAEEVSTNYPLQITESRCLRLRHCPTPFSERTDPEIPIMLGPDDLLPSIRTNVNLVKSVLQGENGYEEAVHRTANHQHFEGR